MSRIIFSLLTAALLLTACTGPQGPAGPDGAQGIQGTTGQTGAAGQNGADGKAGATGPAGQTGATGSQGSSGTNGTPGTNGTNGAPGSPGPTGPTGPQGPTGNANVQQYSFGASATGASFLYEIPDFIQTKLDSSVVLTYINKSGNWFSVPGRGVGNFYYTERFDSVFDGKLRVYVATYDTTTNNSYKTSFDAFRVIVIPVSSITPLSLHGPNLNDYNAVKAYYHLGN